MDTGELEKLANTKTEFYKKMNQGKYANEWLLIQVADNLNDNGIKLKDGECYGFIKYPIIGGGYMSENFKPISALDYITFMGKLYEDLHKLPDDEKIELNLTAKNIYSLSLN
ncbi:MAG: T6SS immunity protein Tdi1 domain-containing protein [Pseudomonadota bacterium]